MGSDKTTATLLGLTAGCITFLLLGVAGHPIRVTSAPTAQPQQPDGMTVRAKVTAYCPCSKCCGKWADGKTSRNRNARTTRGVAVDPKKISYGSMVTIPGAGTFEADDTGGAMRNADGYHINLRFPTHQQALNWGVQWLDVVIK